MRPKEKKKEREKKIKKLYKTSIELGKYNSEGKIYKHVLESFKDILEFQASSICRVQNGCFVVKATDAKNVEEGEKRSKDEGIRGLTYQNQESYLIDDLSEWDDAQPSDTDFKSAISVPIKDEGVFQALSSEKNYFDEYDLEMAEMLVSHMWQVIEGIKYQDELKSNRIWLSQIVENSSVPTFVIDEEHEVTDWNKACEKLTDIPKSEMVGTKDAWQAFYDEERPVMADLILENAHEKEIEEYYGDKFTNSAVLPEAYEAEDFFPGFDEEGVWVYFTAAPIKDDEGKIVGAIETLEDITERKKHEEKLERRNESIKGIHRKATELKMCETLEEVCELVVETSEQILDFEVCGIDFVEDGQFVPIAVSSEIEDGFIKRELKEAGISRKVWEENESRLVKDSREVDFSKPVVEDYRSSITIPMGDYGIYQALSTEVEGLDEKDLEYAEILVNHANEAINRIKSKEKLRKSKEKVEKLHQASSELEVCQSEEEVFKLAAKAAEDILDFDICSFSKVEDDRIIVKESTSGLLEDSYSQRPVEEGGIDTKTYMNQESYLIKNVNKNEDVKPVNSKYRSAISIPIGEYGIFQAVSTEVEHFDEEDLQMAELLISHVTEALKRLETEEREEFLHSLLRHDVGNKNQLIKGYLELVKDYDLPEDVEDFVDKMDQAAGNSLEIIEKVRKLRKIGKEEEIGEVYLGSVIDKVLLERQDQLQENDIKIEMSEPDGKVRGGRLLEELFSNLIENSIQHSECEAIRISSRDEDEKFIVTMEDDGEGISDELKGEVFEEGFTGKESEGTGLGLYIVKEIARSYGGSVELKDSELGGARFEVSLEKCED